MGMTCRHGMQDQPRRGRRAHHPGSPSMPCSAHMAHMHERRCWYRLAGAGTWGAGTGPCSGQRQRPFGQHIAEVWGRAGGAATSIPASLRPFRCAPLPFHASGLQTWLAAQPSVCTPHLPLRATVVQCEPIAARHHCQLQQHLYVRHGQRRADAAAAAGTKHKLCTPGTALERQEANWVEGVGAKGAGGARPAHIRPLHVVERHPATGSGGEGRGPSGGAQAGGGIHVGQEGCQDCSRAGRPGGGARRRGAWPRGCARCEGGAARGCGLLCSRPLVTNGHELGGKGADLVSRLAHSMPPRCAS